MTYKAFCLVFSLKLKVTKINQWNIKFNRLQFTTNDKGNKAYSIKITKSSNCSKEDEPLHFLGAKSVELTGVSST
ncbi:hypothetical protein BC008_38075 [Mastigocoleus testarum BC008]|uniref:Uncharacterized protein n=1 Tax=Mastigocoleus testarum BC008 TaxID=371196 RepID=A0A0V7ZDT3_9CYAN|nr:hypothetical protein BC008_38075 [Mastigocoleus testarum BC008]